MRSEDDLLVERRIDSQRHNWQIAGGITGSSTPSWAERRGSGLFRRGISGELGGNVNELGILLVSITLQVSLVATLAVWLAFI